MTSALGSESPHSADGKRGGALMLLPFPTIMRSRTLLPAVKKEAAIRRNQHDQDPTATSGQALSRRSP
jgi:hypothetical protein